MASPAHTVPATAPANANDKWPGIDVILSQAWEGLKVNRKPVAVYTGFSGGAAILDGIMFSSKPLESGMHTTSAGGIFSFIATIIFLVGMSLLGLAMADRKELPVSRLVVMDMRLLYTIGMVLLLTLAVGIGFLLLIVPGVILLTMWCLAGYDIAELRAGPIHSLKRSAGLTKGYRLRIFVLMLVVLGFAIVASLLGFIPFLGSFIFGPFSAFFYGIFAVVYRVLQAETQTKVNQVPGASPAGSV